MGENAGSFRKGSDGCEQKEEPRREAGWGLGRGALQPQHYFLSPKGAPVFVMR